MENKIDRGENEFFKALDTVGCSCGSCNIVKESQVEHRHEHADDLAAAEDLHLDHDHHHHHGIKSGMGKYGRLIGASVLFSVGLFVGFSGIYQVAIFIVAYLLIAQKVLVTAVKNVIKGQMFDENFLMAIASIVAFAIGEYAEGVAVMIFYALGQLAEDYAIDKSKGSISKLLDLKPDYATLKTEDGTRLVKPNEVSVGDIIMVKAGERIPLDGIVISGDSLVDTAMLTGESLPVHALVNTEVFSGTINLHGVLEVRVLKVFGESAVSKILKMVEKANENKAPTEKFITRFAKVYTPAVVFTAAAIALVPPLLLGQTFSTWLYRGAIFLVVSCPCALVISVPLGYFGGIGAAARKGVLIKGGEYLEGLKNAKTIVFDKTGTLTKGNFSIERIDAVSDVPEAALRKIAAHLEKFSNHPIAKAIVASYEGPIDEGAVSQVSEQAGHGIRALYEGRSVLIGNALLMAADGIEVQAEDAVGTTLYLAVDRHLAGVFHIRDEIKDKTVEGLARLRHLGIEKFVMLSGDKKEIAESVGNNLGVDDVYYELLPEDKLTLLERLLAEDERVIFVGDGINDAPVLSRADVGIAMGRLGSDVAVESADVVLMTDEITAIADGIEVSRFTGQIIVQNIVMALGIKLGIMLLGTFGYATLWMAIFGDVGVAMMAILNSSRPVYKVTRA